MTKEHFQSVIENRNYPRLVRFIKDLIYAKIPVSHIDTNDWGCNLRPSVYLHNKTNMFLIRRYSRCSSRDLNNAVKFFKS
jgi:hypothetical protein